MADTLDTEAGLPDDAPDESPAAAPEEKPLHELLSEFEQGQPEQPEVQRLPSDRDHTHPESMAPANGYDVASVEAQYVEIGNAAIAGASEELEKLGVDYPEAVAKSFLYERATNNERFGAALKNALDDPRTWQRELSKAYVDMNKQYSSRIDREVTEDRAAITFAVRGHGQPPDPDEIDAAEYAAAKNMTDAEFETWVRSKGNGL